MKRTTARRSILLSISLCAAVSPAASPLSPVDAFASGLQARIGGSDTLRCRISAACALTTGNLAAFVDENWTSRGIALLGFGLASPGCDLGPLRESGLLSALNHPASIGSIAERSAAALDRSFDSGSLTGGVIRLYGSPIRRRGVELYGATRGGLAPNGTRIGGLLLTTELGAGFSVDIGSKLVLFGPREEDDEWFTAASGANPPSIFRTGARITYRRRKTTAAVTGGAAFSDCLRPASFVTGSVTYSGDLPAGEHVRQPSYSVGIDAGAIAPDYVGDDGRRTARTLVVRPALSLRLPGMSISGWYRCDLYPLPVLPAAYRRIVHVGSVSGEVRFGALVVGAAVRPQLDFTADGRTLYRVRCGPRARIAAGPLALEAALQLTRSNLDEPEVGARLALSSQGEYGMAGISIDVDEGEARFKAEAALAGGWWRLTGSLVVPEVLAVDFGVPRVSLGGGFAGPFERASASVSVEIGR